MLIRPVGFAALAVLGGAPSPQLFNQTEFCLPVSYALEKSVDHEVTRWGVPLLLPTLLSPAPRSWRRGSLGGEPARADQEIRSWGSASLHHQLPHIAFTEGVESHSELEDSDYEEPFDPKPKKIFLDEYKPSDFAVDSINLLFKLDRDDTKVMSTSVMRRLPSTPPQDLVLDGEDLLLEQLLLNGKVLAEDPDNGYSFEDDGRLRIPRSLLPENGDVPFNLFISVAIEPAANRWQKGLFISQNNFVTQCEPGGFRRIMYFLDRPDILTRYRVRLEADAKLYPVLLSNGNKIASGSIDLSPGRHYAVFDDPHPKASHFFGLVAGNLGVVQDSFMTSSGRLVTLQFFSHPADVDKLDCARQALKKSMLWDEENFGREYDLDLLNVVCFDNFGGQMANKGLLIFDCDTLLTDPKISTDAETFKVISAVGHEYFRNWTGSRVSLRDWFQLSINAGLTKFRESLFTAAMWSPELRRIDGVSYLISKIFFLDNGSRAMPLRPSSYEDVYDLYSPTLHWKAAEVIRAYQTLLGVDGFRKGMDLYFERHDGKAVTIEDFRMAMEDANNVDLRQFDRWYSQANTPEIRVEDATYNPDLKAFSITLSQFTPPTRAQPRKLPLMIPIKVGLIGKKSKKDVLDPPTMVVKLDSEKKTTYIFDVEEDCVPSVHREFAAPVKSYDRLTEDQRAFLLAYDSDPVNKWRSARVLFFSFILSRAVLSRQGRNAEFTPLPAHFIDALRILLLDDKANLFVKALCLTVPKIRDLSEKFRPTDPDALHLARRSVILDVARALKKEMVEIFEQLFVPRAGCHGYQQLAKRKLRNELLVYLSESRDREAAGRAFKYFSEAECMTDKYFALMALSSMNQPERDVALDRFYKEAEGKLHDAAIEGPPLNPSASTNAHLWRAEPAAVWTARYDVPIAVAGNPRLINGWLSVQASADLPDQVERVAQLQEHPAFSFRNPNSVRSLLFDFVLTNDVHFHRKDGKGYVLLADAVLKLDEAGSILAKPAANLFSGWRNLKEDRQALMKHQLKRILKEPALSDNVRKVVLEAFNSRGRPKRS